MAIHCIALVEALTNELPCPIDCTLEKSFVTPGGKPPKKGMRAMYSEVDRTLRLLHSPCCAAFDNIKVSL